jgi:uncharacterized cysteine cluster protein YcgN (CxxCxxCC family)
MSDKEKEIRKWLAKHDTWYTGNESKYHIHGDGSIYVQQNVNIQGSNLVEIPYEFKSGQDAFNCTNCNLKTLKNIPRDCDVYAFFNELESLPKYLHPYILDEDCVIIDSEEIGITSISTNTQKIYIDTNIFIKVQRELKLKSLT